MAFWKPRLCVVFCNRRNIILLELFKSLRANFLLITEEEERIPVPFNPHHIRVGPRCKQVLHFHHSRNLTGIGSMQPKKSDNEEGTCLGHPIVCVLVRAAVKSCPRNESRQEKTRINVRGFCAGSYAGLSLVHILKARHANHCPSHDVARRGGPFSEAGCCPVEAAHLAYIWTPRTLSSLLELLMEHFAQHSVPQMEFINGMLQERFRLSEPFTSPEQVRDFFVQEICQWNEQWQPTSLLLLFAGFLRKYSLAARCGILRCDGAM